MVVMVPSTSNARKLAKEDEVEVHLLAVKKDYRNNNLGHRLLSELILQAQNEGYKKIIIWTQFLSLYSIFINLKNSWCTHLRRSHDARHY
ncbi:hypothetical protein PE36_03411 [Moritella sp. PE36]|uniref:GNAT family N-acetyltransferase n=1 Tax=Moritella sp. PE36 TaxID=58051 RepID=UPI0001568805|nr:hypothetical protein PE36_03411 [Moritella sp. PE36]